MKTNPKIIVTPMPLWHREFDFDKDKKNMDKIAESIKRHIDDICDVEVQWEDTLAEEEK